MNAALRKNPVFWLMWLLPGAAVLGGFATLAIAMQDADRALPDIYHWEGDLLDADFERARHAARLGLEGELQIAAGACRLRLQGATTDTVSLMLTHGTNTRLDRLQTLTRGADGVYHAACEPLAPGKWRVALRDDARTWSLRAELNESQTRVEMRARSPEGPGA